MNFLDGRSTLCAFHTKFNDNLPACRFDSDKCKSADDDKTKINIKNIIMCRLCRLKPVFETFRNSEMQWIAPGAICTLRTTPRRIQSHSLAILALVFEVDDARFVTNRLSIGGISWCIFLHRANENDDFVFVVLIQSPIFMSLVSALCTLHHTGLISYRILLNYFFGFLFQMV